MYDIHDTEEIRARLHRGGNRMSNLYPEVGKLCSVMQPNVTMSVGQGLKYLEVLS